MIRIRDISLPPDGDMARLVQAAARQLRISPNEIKQLDLKRRSVDARKKNDVRIIYTVDVAVKGREDKILKMAHCARASLAQDPVYHVPQPRSIPAQRPVIVGFGPAGMFAALVLSMAGLRPLVLERGQDAKARHAAVLQFWKTWTLDPECNVQFGEGGAGTFSDGKLNTGVKNERIGWILEQFAGAGASADILYDAKPHIGTDELVTVVQNLRETIIHYGGEVRFGVKVTGLVTEDGRVTGVRAGDDEITAEVVILAEGTNSMLSERCLGNARPKADQMAVGIKEVFELPSDVIEDRFLLPEGEGAAMLFVGDCTKGSVGGGFLYTNKDSISLGLVATIEELSTSGTTIYQAMEDFKHHPAVAPIIRDATMVEHSGHMVSEGGYDMIPEYVYDGCLIAGDAAMLCMNLGYQVRGMDLAVASGQFAAEAACAAIDGGNVSAQALALYRTMLEDSFVIKDMKTFRAWPQTMEHWDRMFTEYPTMVAEVFNAMFVVDGEPQQHLTKRIIPVVKQRGLLRLAKEVRGALKAL